MRKRSHATSFIAEVVLSPALIFGLILVGASSNASAIRAEVMVGERPYLFESIDTPTPGATTVREVSGINNNGVMVGTFAGANNTFGFVQGPGIPFKQISYDNFTELLKINDSNQAVGNSVLGAFTTAVPSGSFTRINSPSEFYTNVAGISNENVIVGEALPKHGAPIYKGFMQGEQLPFTLFSPGNSPASVFPSANDVRPHSIALSAPFPNTLIVGNIDNAAFLAQGNPNSDLAYTNISSDLNLALQSMGTRSGPSEAWGVNGSGIVVGSFTPYTDTYRGFIDEANSFSVIDAPNSNSTNVFDINDKGQIVGGFEDRQANVHGFLMTPWDSSIAGLSPANPVLPSTTINDVFIFQNPAPGLWFDPGSLAPAFTYSLTGGATFIEVALSPDSFGFGPVEVVVGGHIVGTLNPGADFFFTPGVTTFSLNGISTEGNHSAFPIFLNFTGTTSLAVSPVPEPSSLVLMSIGLIGLFGYGWRQRGKAA